MWMFFLTQTWTVLVLLLACSLLIFLSFNTVMLAGQLCLWVLTVYLWLVSVDKASSISSWPQTIFSWHRTLTGSRGLELFDPEVEGTMMLWNVCNCKQSTQQIFQLTWGISNTAVSTSDLASLNFMTRTPHGLSCARDDKIFYLLWHSLSNAMRAKGSYTNCI